MSASRVESGAGRSSAAAGVASSSTYRASLLVLLRSFAYFLIRLKKEFANNSKACLFENYFTAPTRVPLFLVSTVP